jgi:hypothetical protein
VATDKNFKVKNGIDAGGAITGTSIVRSGGTSSQFLKADGSVDSSTYLTTGTASSTYQPLDTDLTAIADLASGTGLLKNTSGTWSLDTSTYLTTGTASSTYALIASPSLTGTPFSTTAAVDTNTTQIATTAFVVGQASGANPLALGSVAQGTSLRYSRQDHVHPTTGLALLAGATFTGQIQSTLANSTTTGGGQIYLNGSNGNRIDFGTAGVQAPTTTTRSTGTKIVLYPAISPSGVDFALGMESASFWQSIENSSAQFKWYGGTTQVASLSGAGLFTAVSKSFDIQHPTKPDMRLRYGSLEGPENGVYVRGNTKENIIELPEVWTGLVDESTITAIISSVGKFQKVYVEKIEGNKVYIGGRVKEISYVIFGERKDIDKITVEY